MSGNLASQVLCHLHHHPYHLSSLHLLDTDVELHEILGTIFQMKISRDGARFYPEVISSSRKLNPALSSLQQLSVMSRNFNTEASLAVLQLLRKLRVLRCPCSVESALLTLHKVDPEMTLDLCMLKIRGDSQEDLEKLIRMCPNLRDLGIIHADIAHMSSLSELARLRQLTSLTLCAVCEQLVVSAVTSVGSQLLELKIKYKESCQFLLDSIITIQSVCCRLELLELVNVVITVAASRHNLVSLRSGQSDHVTARSSHGLRRSKVWGTVSDRSVMEELLRLIACGGTLERLELHVNGDVLTDEVVTTFVSTQRLSNLSIVDLGAGVITVSAITSLLTLPALSELYIHRMNFPFVQCGAFEDLQLELRTGNYRCDLQTVISIPSVTRLLR